MDRRSFLAVSTATLTPLSGCVSSEEIPGSGGDTESSPTPENESSSEETSGDEEGGSTDESPSVGGTFLADESHPDAELIEHTFENTGETTSPWAVTGIVSHSQENRADIPVSVNFLEGDTVFYDTYTMPTDIASDQSAEFAVRLRGEPERVDRYEIIVDLQ